MAGGKIKADELIESEKIINDLSRINIELKEMVDSLDVRLRKSVPVLNQLKINNSQSIKDAALAMKEANAALEQKIKLEKAEELNRKALDEATKRALKIEQEKQKLEKETIKTQKEKIKIDQAAQKETEKKNSLYATESKRLNDLRKAYKDLVLAEGDAGKEAKKLGAEMLALDAKLKKVDASAGQFQRDVGNYGKGRAGDVFAGNLYFAAASKIGSAFTGAIQKASELDKSLQNLSAITGASGKDLEFYGKEAVEMGRSVNGGSVAVVEAIKLIGSAKPELLKNKEALTQVTDQAILLSKAAGLELPDAATRLTDALNQFGAPASAAGKYVDILAAGAKAGAAEVPEVTDALLKFGVAAKSSNISIQESVGAIELLAEKGEKGAEAGTKLRNVFGKLDIAKALPREAISQLKAAGVNLDVLSDKTLPLAARLKELSKIQGNATAISKTFGEENKTAAQILIENISRLEELTKAVDENGVAAQQATTNTDTFAQSLTEAGNAFDRLVASFSSKESVIGNVFKTIVQGFTAVIDAITEITTGGFGERVNIEGIQRLGKVTKEAAKELASFGLKVEDGSKSLNKSQQAIFDLYEVTGLYVQRINDQNATQKEAIKIQEDLKKEMLRQNELFKSGALQSGDLSIRISILKKRLQEATEAAKRFNAVNVGGGGGLTPDEIEKRAKAQEDLRNRIRQIQINAIADDKQRAIEQAQFDYEKEIEKVEKIEASEESKNNLILALGQELRSKLNKIDDDEEKKANEKRIAEIAKINQAEENIRQENLAFELEEKQAQFEKEKELALESDKKITEQELENLKALLDQSTELRRQALKDKYEYERTTGNLTKEELAALENKYNNDLLRLDRDYLKAKKDLEDEARQTSHDADREALEKRREMLFDYLNKSIALAEKEIKETSELRQKALDDEISRREKNIELQQDLAARGQKNTLAFEEQELAKAQLRKEQEKQKEIKREKELAFLKLLAGYAEKNPEQALQKALIDTALASVISAAFFDGTEKVSDDLEGNPNKRDGYIVRVDGSERVLTGEQNKMIGNLSNEELASLAYNYNNGIFLPSYAMNTPELLKGSANNIYESAQLNQLMVLNKKIESLEATIKNRPVGGNELTPLGDVLNWTFKNGLKQIKVNKHKPIRI